MARVSSCTVRWVEPSVLIVDDEPEVLEALVRTVQPLGYPLRSAGGAREALELLEHAPAEVVVSDYQMPEMDGVAFLRRVRERWPHTQRVLVSGAADHQAVERASRDGDLDRYIGKPWDGAQLRIALRSAVAQHRLDVENAELQASLEDRVRLRTQQLGRAKLEWERSFDAIGDPLAILTRDRVVRRANLAYAQVGGRDIPSVPGRPCPQALFGRAQVCEGCPRHRLGRPYARA